MSKKSAKTSTTPATPTDPATLIARAPSHRWQRGCEAEEVHIDPGSKRRTQRVFNAVLSLEKSGCIQNAHVVAATRWVADYEWNQRSPYVDPITASIRSSGGGPGMHLAAGVDASTRHRQATQAVGMRGDALLRAVVGEGCSLREIARRSGEGTAARLSSGRAMMSWNSLKT